LLIFDLLIFDLGSRSLRELGGFDLSVNKSKINNQQFVVRDWFHHPEKSRLK